MFLKQAEKLNQKMIMVVGWWCSECMYECVNDGVCGVHDGVLMVCLMLLLCVILCVVV